MKKIKISITAVTSLAISIIAFVLYVMVLNGSDVYILWILASIAALCFPVFSKYRRNKSGSNGKPLEITALVLGAFDFYFVIFAATGWNIYMAYALVAIVCILYAKHFNKPTGKKPEPEEGLRAAVPINRDERDPTIPSDNPKSPREDSTEINNADFPEARRTAQVAVPSVIQETPVTTLTAGTQTHPIAKVVIISLLIFCLVVCAVFCGFFALNYQNGINAMNNQNFIVAYQYFEHIPSGHQLFPDEYAYIQAGVLMEEGKYIESLKAFDNLNGIPVPSSIPETLIEKIMGEGAYLSLLETTSELQNITIPATTLEALIAKIYSVGKTAYKNDDFPVAKENFTAISEYKQSEDYLLLIGCKYGTLAQYMVNGCYADLIRLIGFEDADRIIIENQSTAIRFLKGTWEAGQKYNPLYFKIDAQNQAWSNLPHNEADGYYYLSDGIYSVGETESKAIKCFRFSIIDEDTISVYCYKDGSTHKLYRQ